MLLDQFGRPLQQVSAAELLERQAVAAMGSVRQIQTGHPADGLNPVKLASILREAETGDWPAILGAADFRIGAEMADQDDFVDGTGHYLASSRWGVVGKALCSTPSSRRPARRLPGLTIKNPSSKT